jgi:hypothetical protein
MSRLLDRSGDDRHLLHRRPSDKKKPFRWNPGAMLRQKSVETLNWLA